ncbi:putative cysteine peptidase [[Mycoplasma] anseris]|uniref:Uncharacterized protein n=1 Tax=[Mycoplasma] anseris TaxID=92400 RepID=A0A2Z4NDJ8_9BACT|nr:hypothetical protein [[Mycoplasma] anseris]AWX69661.1 hypothetical protein DP065_02820 [[Mycoplasma] anseris]
MKKLSSSNKWDFKSIQTATNFHYDSLKIIHAEKEVSHSWWFKTAVNEYDFGYADDSHSTLEPGRSEGLCHYVAGAMLLQYGEFFWSSNVFSDTQYKKHFSSIGSNLNYRNYANKAKIGCPTVNRKLTLDLYEKREYGKGAKITTSIYFRDPLIAFLNNSKEDNYIKKPEITFHRRSLYWIKPWKWIRDDKPCIVYGAIPNIGGGFVSHAVIVYGTFDRGNKVLCHFGWSNYSQVILSTSLWNGVWLIGMSKTGNSKLPKKYFEYDDKFYSGPEITNILKELDK